MKYLKKNTIKAFFLFARSAEEPVNRHAADETLPGILFDKPGKSNAYLDFLDGLSSGEHAELTTLYLLGCEKVRSMPEWQSKLTQLMDTPSDDLEKANPQRIPQIIRRGLEKLARFNKTPHLTLPPQSVPEKSDEPNQLLIRLCGRFTLDSYLEKYGEQDPMKRQMTLLDIKGYLSEPQERKAMGLPPLLNRSPLEGIHLDKKPI
jgi:hypothetical protein